MATLKQGHCSVARWLKHLLAIAMGVSVGVGLYLGASKLVVTSTRSDPRRSGAPYHGDAGKALLDAVLDGRADIVRRLLSSGVDPNTRESDAGMTALHLAMLAGHDDVAALLREHGANDSIEDRFGRTPADAAAQFADRESRMLIPASRLDGPFDSRAVVMIMCPCRTLGGVWSYVSRRVGFVIGDGRTVATAAHCTDDFDEQACDGHLSKPVVVSPYLGDACEARVVAMDHGNDLALLRVDWQGHPALVPASEEELASAREVLLAAHPPSGEKDAPHQPIPRGVFFERVPALRFDPQDGEGSLVVGPVKYAGRGWSGAPMLLADSGHVAGVLSSRSEANSRGVTLYCNIMGPDGTKLCSLLEQAGIPGRGQTGGDTGKPRPALADEAFGALMDCHDALFAQRLSDALRHASRLTALRAQSAHAHLLQAWLALELRDQTKDLEQVETGFRRAVELAPTSILATASYGFTLRRLQRYDAALVQLDRARDLDPDNLFVRMARVQVLRPSDSLAAEDAARRLVEDHPDCVGCWLELAWTLRDRGQYAGVVEALRRGEELDAEKLHRGLLAEALAKTGQLDEAECHYEQMAREHSCAQCWFAYAKFLIDHRPDRVSDALAALDQAESLNDPQLVEPDELHRWRGKLRELPRRHADTEVEHGEGHDPPK